MLSGFPGIGPIAPYGAFCAVGRARPQPPPRHATKATEGLFDGFSLELLSQGELRDVLRLEETMPNFLNAVEGGIRPP